MGEITQTTARGGDAGQAPRGDLLPPLGARPEADVDHGARQGVRRGAEHRPRGLVRACGRRAADPPSRQRDVHRRAQVDGHSGRQGGGSAAAVKRNTCGATCPAAWSRSCACAAAMRCCWDGDHLQGLPDGAPDWEDLLRRQFARPDHWRHISGDALLASEPPVDSDCHGP